MKLYEIRDNCNDALIALGVVASMAWCVYGFWTLDSGETHNFAVLFLAIASALAGCLAAALHSAAWRIGLWIAGRDSYLCLPIRD